MRTLINVRDILGEYNQPLLCPRCGLQQTAVQATLDLRNGRTFIVRHGDCSTHGPFMEKKVVKGVVMLGRDAQIIPNPEYPQALAEKKGGANDGV